MYFREKTIKHIWIFVPRCPDIPLTIRSLYKIALLANLCGKNITALMSRLKKEKKKKQQARETGCHF